MRTNIVLDEELVTAAMELTGIRTKRQIVHLALEELVKHRNRKNLLDLAGKVPLNDDFDHKRLRELRSDSG